MRTVKKLASILSSFIIGLCICCGCDNGEEYGGFYDLEYAYENELLTKDDIKTIAEKHNSKQLETVRSEAETELKKAYAAKYPRDDSTYKDVVIDEYLGEYKGCFVMIIRYNDEYAAAEYSTVTIAETEIRYSDGLRIVVYKRSYGK